jgi:hypothetical protein
MSCNLRRAWRAFVGQPDLSRAKDGGEGQVKIVHIRDAFATWTPFV